MYRARCHQAMKEQLAEKRAHSHETLPVSHLFAGIKGSASK